ncbi:Protein kinase domain - like 10 [Theobroma cacao]|nr:Protein kinase domain - like 10 [Theobroma cacao]
MPITIKVDVYSYGILLLEWIDRERKAGGGELFSEKSAFTLNEKSRNERKREDLRGTRFCIMSEEGENALRLSDRVCEGMASCFKWLTRFYNEGQNRLLLYKYISNGSLAKFLFENSRLEWYQKIEIALGIARGLCYLHGEYSLQIIHCDVKPQNILQDDLFLARISDFGLAKLLKTN